jgi:hypothetical protein
MIRTVATALSFLLWAAPAFAQSPADMEKLSDFLDKQNEIVLLAQQNLIGMGLGLSEPESSRIDQITNITVTVQMATQALVTLSHIHSMMRDERDRMIVYRHTVTQARSVVKHSELSNRAVNRNLALLRSPAAISEAQKLRDALQAIERQVMQTIPKSMEPRNH